MRSSRGRTGNPYCCTRVGVIIFTWLPLSARALKFLPSMVSSTSISGLIQCKVCPPASNCGFRICLIMRTFTSGREIADPRAGGLLSPTPLEFAWSQCHLLNALWWGQPQAKWPGNLHTKHCHSSHW